MEIAASIESLRGLLGAHRVAGRRIALVPTMGALHEGHLALVDAARARADVVVMSVFVNPLQFLPGEDLARYPRPIERDRELAANRGVAVLFTPSPDEMYDARSEIRVVAGEAASRWEGAIRPGHFTGVLTIVAKLFNLVQPSVAIFGRKDIQQAVLIRQMVHDLDFPVSIVVVPTVREADGLALSSRNAYLDRDDREKALGLSRALRAAGAEWARGARDASALSHTAERVLRETSGLVADYIAVADPDRLAPVDRADAGTVVAIAARVGKTRLIDNIILGEDPD